MAYLEAFTALGKRVVPLDEERLTVGRGSECGIVLGEDQAVSRLHAVFDLVEGGWCLQDLHSRNGTYVNGERISDVVALRPDDEIRIGSWRFRYCANDADPSATIREDQPSQPLPLSAAAGLSEREKDVLRLLAQGATDQEIARQLFIAVATVRSHLDRIREKTGCRRRPALTRLAIEQGLVNAGPSGVPAS